jgi:predicted HicB family RNase H-like nuclease
MTLEYNGFRGSVHFSKEDNCYYGKVLDLEKSLISYEGKTVEELEEDFRGAVDDYLEILAYLESSRKS